MRTYVYIDGFNFYYGAVKETPYKWLDFKSLLQKLLPKHLNYDCAVVISNDSDLAEALKIARNHHHREIGVIKINRKWRFSKQLQKYSTFTREIRTGMLTSSQLPDPIPGTRLRKPASW